MGDWQLEMDQDKCAEQLAWNWLKGEEAAVRARLSRVPHTERTFLMALAWSKMRRMGLTLRARDFEEHVVKPHLRYAHERESRIHAGEEGLGTGAMD